MKIQDISIGKGKEMLTEIKLPDDYIPFNHLTICSNIIINGKIIVEIDGNVPLLIGKGELPLVWLRVMVSPNEWKYVVERNVSLNQNINVELSKINNAVKIVYRDKYKIVKTIVNVIKNTENDVIVDEMDLRPVGLTIYGDKDELHIGTNTLKNNTFSNIHTMIKIGK
jgi:hypothetical protein